MRALITERLARLSALGSPQAAAGLREAAVLVPLFERPVGLTLLLAQRTQHLHHHPGQISFPGGGIEAHDADPVAAALRETHEEMGIAPAHVDVVGQLAPIETRTGFRITPVVGFVDPDVTLKLDAFEVDEAFEVPLDFVLDPRNCEWHTRRFNGIEVGYYQFNYRGRVIWGATAQILVNFARELDVPLPPAE
ncbi:MAG TPA: CoA pyrophosphatase [Burkholderiales bacterium]